MRRTGGVGCALAVWSLSLMFAASALADTTINFDDLPSGTTLTNQYANAGGSGQGVVFGPLPGSAGDSARPVITTAVGQAQSGSQVADINCPSCNEGLGYIPHTTATLAVPRSRVSVYAGLLGERASPCAQGGTTSTCAVVQLLAFDSNGNRIAASAPVTLTQGAGVHTLLSVSTSSDQIVGFEVTARDPTDNFKDVALDNLSFAPPSRSSPPDFTLTPASTNMVVSHGQSVSDPISIGRIAGSSGQIRLDVGALPAGVHAQFSPDPADSTSTLTLTADRTVQTATAAITITGTPLSATAGTSPHSFSLNLQVQSVCGDVITAQDLIDALGSGCKYINVDDLAQIDLSYVNAHSEQFPGYDAVHTLFGDPLAAVLDIPNGVTLASDRSTRHLGGRIYLSEKFQYPHAMLALGRGSRVTGLRIQGYSYGRGGDETWTIKDEFPTSGLNVTQPDVLIDNNEISNWPSSGVWVHDVQYPNWPPRGGVKNEPHPPRHSHEDDVIAGLARRIHITGNFIHDNVGCTDGYGVNMGDGFALIDRNVFNYDKHDVAGGGNPGSGYIASSNVVLTDGVECRGDSGTGSLTYGGHFDMHGTAGGAGSQHVGGIAGTYIEVRDNAIRGDQRFHIHFGHAFNRRAAFDLRGTPTDKAIFAGNVTEASDGDAVDVSGADQGSLEDHNKLLINDNRYSVNTSQQLAVGDFDGDGCSDAFLATGAVWVYSPCGKRAWRYLNTSRYRLDQLAFGDFNGDGRTDVFTQKGGRWYVSYGGTTGFRLLPAASNIPISEYRIGDFRGDGRADIFRANGSRFYYSNNGASAWIPLVASRFKIGDLRLCDFNGDGRTDVFSLANHQWSVSYGGRTGWQRLNKQLSSHLGELVFGDFDGNGRCDIARVRDGKWQVSWNGTSAWQAQPKQNQQSVSGVLVGHFAGGKQAGLLQFAYGGHALDRFRLSTDFGPVYSWTPQNML